MPANLRPKEDNRVIEMKNLTISYPDTDDQVIKNASFFVERCDVVAIVGPTASGKSSLMRGLLGEMYIVSGSLYVEDSQVAYCGQIAWIKNVSIKDNIIGNSEYDEAWYDTVLDSCLLKPDLERISGGDEALAGSNGCNLSGGQKHRVVSLVCHNFDFIANAVCRRLREDFMRALRSFYLMTHSVHWIDQLHRRCTLDCSVKKAFCTGASLLSW